MEENNKDTGRNKIAAEWDKERRTAIKSKTKAKAWMCYECGDNVSPCPAFDLDDKKYCPADHTTGNKSKYVPVTIYVTSVARAMEGVIAKARKGTYGDIMKALDKLDKVRKAQRKGDIWTS